MAHWLPNPMVRRILTTRHHRPAVGKQGTTMWKSVRFSYRPQWVTMIMRSAWESTSPGTASASAGQVRTPTTYSTSARSESRRGRGQNDRAYRYGDLEICHSAVALIMVVSAVFTGYAEGN